MALLIRMERIGSLLLLLLLAAGFRSGGSFHYDAPSDCQWSLMNTSSQTTSPASGVNEVALHCRLRTINSQFDQTNFSVVPREHTASLTIECSDSLLYQR